MARKLMLPGDVIDVAFVPVLIYGPPGCGKTQMAQTAERPVTLDFDKGGHRLRLDRGAFMQFDTWTDVVEAGQAGDFDEYATIVIDTGGRALDTMIPEILEESAKNGYRGNLSPQGYGVLGSRFNTWMKTVRSWGKDVVMLCHSEAEATEAGGTCHRPEFPGKMAWKEIHKSFDMIGFVRYEGKQRVLDFSPGEAHVGKNAGGFDPFKVPDLEKNKTFLANIIRDTKARLGQTSRQSAEAAQAAEEWAAEIGKADTPAHLNALIPRIEAAPDHVARRLRPLVARHATGKGWKYDKGTRTFAEGKS